MSRTRHGRIDRSRANVPALEDAPRGPSKPRSWTPATLNTDEPQTALPSGAPADDPATRHAIVTAALRGISSSEGMRVTTARIADGSVSRVSVATARVDDTITMTGAERAERHIRDAAELAQMVVDPASVHHFVIPGARLDGNDLCVGWYCDRLTRMIYSVMWVEHGDATGGGSFRPDARVRVSMETLENSVSPHFSAISCCEAMLEGRVPSGHHRFMALASQRLAEAQTGQPVLLDEAGTIPTARSGPMLVSSAYRERLQREGRFFVITAWDEPRGRALLYSEEHDKIYLFAQSRDGDWTTSPDRAIDAPFTRNASETQTAELAMRICLRYTPAAPHDVMVARAQRAYEALHAFKIGVVGESRPSIWSIVRSDLRYCWQALRQLFDWRKRP